MRVGIFGGTFNPIHVGHLLLAETAREELSLDRVLFIPTGRPPHKRAPGLLDGVSRLRMVRLAIQDHPAFAASDIELKRPGPSYSIDTVAVLHRALPEAKLFLLIGQDMLAVRWVRWPELKRLCTLAAVRRHGARLPAPPQNFGGAKAGRARMERGIRWLEMPAMDISSSNIRARLAAGRSIRYLVPPAVERYIRQHGLYRVPRRSSR
jgi:nicotinate-nucleotide adenylyltransferase